MIMKWSEIKKWAKAKGYEVDRTKKEKNKYLFIQKFQIQNLSGILIFSLSIKTEYFFI